MVTYSDMVTLILAFFVLLFSFATIDEAKFHDVITSLRITFMGSEGVLTGTTEPMEFPQVDPDLLAEAEETVARIRAFIAEQGLEETINMIIDERGIVLEISDVLFFDPAKADLKDGALEILGYVAELLESLDNDVIVEGHTDNVPINTYLFPSNWELSVARAVVVVRHLVEVRQLKPSRFAAVGYGEFHPVASNLTAEGRAKNRRVNIIISTPQLSTRKEPQ